jgi:quinol monooxygenase YgiN
MVRMVAEWSLPIGQVRAVTVALHSLVAEVRSEHGWLGCSVSADMTSLATVRYVEEWRTEDDLRRRLQSDAFFHFVALIEGSTEPPRVEFMLPHQVRGLDFAEEARRSTP